jgi:hypothetical protein
VIRRALTVSILATLPFAACAAAPAATTTRTSVVAVDPAPTKLAVIILENRDRKRAETEMTYLPALERQYAGATDYRAVADPSLPNYLALAFGNTFGVIDDRNATKHPEHGRSIFGAAIANGNTAHVYAESETTPCSLVDQGLDGYKVRHTGWPYAADERALCQANQTGLQPLAADEANGMPTLSWIIGNVQHDGHRPSNDRIADAWLRDTIMPPLLASPDFQSGALTVVVTFDEGRDLTVDGDIVMFVVLNKALDGAHLVVTDPLTHYDMWRSQLRYGGSLISGVDALAAFGL